MEKYSTHKYSLIFLIVLLVIALGAFAYIMWVPGTSNLSNHSESSSQVSKNTDTTTTTNSVTGSQNQGGSKKGSGGSTTTIKPNQEYILQQNQPVQVGSDLTVTLNHIVKPTSDPGTTAYIAQATVGSSSKYIGWSIGGSAIRTTDEAFGYTFTLKSGTDKTATITIKKN